MWISKKYYKFDSLDKLKKQGNITSGWEVSHDDRQLPIFVDSCERKNYVVK